MGHSFSQSVMDERARQILLGYDQAHDEAHDLQHLLGLAQHHHSLGHGLVTSALLVAALERQGYVVQLRDPDTESAYEGVVRRAEERSERLGDPCKHLTRCADAACNYRMDDAAERPAQLGFDRRRPEQ